MPTARAALRMDPEALGSKGVLGPHGPRRRQLGDGRETHRSRKDPAKIPETNQKAWRGWEVGDSPVVPLLQERGRVPGFSFIFCFLIISLTPIAQKAHSGWQTLLPFTDKTNHCSCFR